MRDPRLRCARNPLPVVGKARILSLGIGFRERSQGACPLPLPGRRSRLPRRLVGDHAPWSGGYRGSLERPRRGPACVRAWRSCAVAADRTERPVARSERIDSDATRSSRALRSRISAPIAPAEACRARVRLVAPSPAAHAASEGHGAAAAHAPSAARGSCAIRVMQRFGMKGVPDACSASTGIRGQSGVDQLGAAMSRSARATHSAPSLMPTIFRPIAGVKIANSRSAPDFERFGKVSMSA